MMENRFGNAFEGIEKILSGQEQILLGQEEIKNELKRKNESSPNDEINKANERLKFNNFIKNSQKSYLYFNLDDEYRKEKSKTLIIVSAMLFVALLTTIFTTISIGFYSTFSVLENVWMAFEVGLIIKILKSRQEYDHFEYSLNSYQRFEMNSDGLYCPVADKKRYKIFKILACISAGLNIIFLIVEYKNPIAIVAIAFEVLVIASAIVAMYFTEDYFYGYTAVLYNGLYGQEKLEIVQDNLLNKIMTKKEYISHYNK